MALIAEQYLIQGLPGNRCRVTDSVRGLTVISLHPAGAAALFIPGKETEAQDFN